MPPKAKYSKEQIVAAAFEIVRRDGPEALTARSLGTKLGSSARPIFTVFQNMEEVQSEVKKAAKALYTEYVERGLAEEKSFRGVGKQYILFAIREPKLFQLLFMSEQKEGTMLYTVLPLIDDNYTKILESIKKDYGITGDQAERLYRHLWIYSHGIATLCATGTCRFTGEEIAQMITEIFISLTD